MEKIPTVDDFLNEEYYHIILDSRDTWINVGDIKRAMIQFAKIHVEAALKEASEKAKITYEYSGNTGSEYCDEYVDKNSILNSYSLDKIK